MGFCPEWLAGSPNLDTSNVWGFWVYVVVRATLAPQLELHPLKCLFSLSS